MKTITLKKAYKKCPALPLDDKKTTNLPPDQQEIVIALLLHSINVLPKVMEALEGAAEWLNDMGCDHEDPEPTCVVCIVNKAIEKADKVKIP